MKSALRSLVTGVTALAVAVGVQTIPGAQAAPAPTDLPTQVTVQLDPSYQHPTFEGWGTSLVWFANATGDYPDEIRSKLVDLVFGEQGLNLNIARYNIGGGNAPDVEDYLRPGGAVEGWWKAPEGTTRTDVDWWSADDPADWNWEADQTQRWWVDAIKGKVTKWETFSNSPPWFMTESGYTSGGFDANTDQLKTSSIEDFTDYMVKVTEYLEDAHGISVDTVDPFNEPNTNYWGTRFDADGKPTASQEGAHMGPELQQKVIRSIAPKLKASTTDAKLSAMDETNPGTFVRNWTSYPQEVKDLVDQMNVHTYGTGQCTAVRDLAKSDDKPLWMSEVEGSWGAGQDFESMEPGLGIAQHMTDDLRELEPSAWVFWQPVEDYDNMAPQDGWAGGNWGSIQVPFDCTASDTLETCQIRTNQKFNTIRNFTHYIKPGDRIVKTNDTHTVAAIREAERSASVVYTNQTSSATDVVVDLSLFGKVGPKATVTPVVTDKNGALVKGAAVKVRGDKATVRVPAQSVTTLLVSDVRGVDAAAALVQDGHVYSLTGVQSKLAMTAGGQGATIEAVVAADAKQLWRIEQVAGGTSNRASYTLRTLDGRQLVVRDGAVVLAEATSDKAGQWYLSTTGDGTWTLANAASAVNLEVGGQKTTAGAAVTVWQPNAATNQAWRIVDETVQSVPSLELWTLPGVPAKLPATVEASYRDGVRGALPVTWSPVPASKWTKSGQVKVRGTATDPTGATHKVIAVVTVDTVKATDPATAATYPGADPEMPATVPATTDRFGAKVQLPVVWDLTGADFSQLGEVTVTGVATLPDGSTLPATAVVTIKEPVEKAVGGVTITSTYTEPGYGTAGLTNGNFEDKAWSNWVSGTPRPGDTFTLQLAEPKDVTRVKVHFYQDGGNVSYARTVQLQALVDGVWTPVSEVVTTDAQGAAAPVFDLPLTTPLRTDQLRAVMVADGYMTVAEVEVFVKSA